MGRYASVSLLTLPPYRITVHTDILQCWAPRQTVRFYLTIVPNPPYYEPGVECATPQREQARYTATLTL